VNYLSKQDERCIHLPKEAFLKPGGTFEVVLPLAGDKMPKHVARRNQIKMTRQPGPVRAGKAGPRVGRPEGPGEDHEPLFPKKQ
jgi:hypothetical protein